ncbi:MAG: GtrA family protein [Aeriscardovia sp.]|nr:GtrA family protein [Aeriscardovia sp.]MBQ3480532.1 GtrA family protein [Aeriscardovia sp.]MBR2673535.1 GtrA family protein [Aeriscardovia sp.]
MKHLIEQFAKFAVVGAVAFFVNWAIMNAMLLMHCSAVLASTVGFVISLVYNYVASMQHVFAHREDMPRWMEMLIFVVSSVIGLLINDLIIWIFTSVMISGVPSGSGKYKLFSNIGMLVATVIVAVWNFLVRKILLDKPAPGHENDNTLARRVGLWAAQHSRQGWN